MPLLNSELLKEGAIMAKLQNWQTEHRFKNRGSFYLFAPMIEFNVMSEVGDTPP
jgi:hypothetical protein